MRKFLSILSVLVISIMMLSVYYIKTNQKSHLTEATLAKAFGSSGARVVNSEVYLWGRFDARYGTLEKLELMAEGISDSLGLVKDNTYSKNKTENDETKGVEIRGVTADKRIVSINAGISSAGGSVGDRTITVSIMQDLSFEGLEEIRETVTKALKKYGVSPKVNSCIIGSFDGKLNNSRLNDVCARMFSGAEAKKVEGISDNNLISVSAYSPFIGDSIKVNGKRVNLNLAIRYNSYENKTYIWLATPVITTEY